jgi:hypothetical protein
LSYRVTVYWADASAGTGWDGFATLSTANNSESDTDFTTFMQKRSSGTSTEMAVALSAGKFVALTSKTSYYLNTKTGATGLDNIYNLNNQS